MSDGQIDKRRKSEAFMLDTLNSTQNVCFSNFLKNKILLNKLCEQKFNEMFFCEECF